MWTTFIGFMGSGKSTVVSHMRRATGRVACDLDGEVENRAGRSVAEIFAKEGEKGFRSRELEALRSLDTAPSLLLATGGGLVETPEAIEVLRGCGVVIWLDAPWEVLRARLEAGPRQERPLVEQQGWTGLRRLLARRLRLYAAAADFRLRTDRLSPENAAQTALLRGLIWRRRREGASA